MPGYRKDSTEAIIDGVLKFVAAGGLLTVAAIVPNSVQIFGKPIDRLLDGFDKREREREVRRVVYYMKQRGLIKYDPRDYEHGMVLTKAGRKRLKSTNIDSIRISRPKKWDRHWRLVFYDIPESEKTKRNSLSLYLKRLGFRQLQFSIWIHPFPSRDEIELVSELLGVSRYVTYVEVNNIDSDKLLRLRFRNLIKYGLDK